MILLFIKMEGTNIKCIREKHFVLRAKRYPSDPLIDTGSEYLIPLSNKLSRGTPALLQYLFVEHKRRSAKKSSTELGESTPPPRREMKSLIRAPKIALPPASCPRENRKVRHGKVNVGARRLRATSLIKAEIARALSRRGSNARITARGDVASPAYRLTNRHQKFRRAALRQTARVYICSHKKYSRESAWMRT